MSKWQVYVAPSAPLFQPPPSLPRQAPHLIDASLSITGQPLPALTVQVPPLPHRPSGLGKHQKISTALLHSLVKLKFPLIRTVVEELVWIIFTQPFASAAGLWTLRILDESVSLLRLPPSFPTLAP